MAEVFVEAFDFEGEIETVEPVLFIVRRFIGQLTTRLENVYRVAGRMTLTIALANGNAYEREFTVASPTADSEVLFRILHSHLEAVRLEHPATAIKLCIEPANAERRQFQLFESPLRDPNRFDETLSRLAAIVGEENVGVAEVGNTHRPDSFRLAPPRFHNVSAPVTTDDFSTGLPLRRWRPAIAAEVRMVRHKPALIESQKVHGIIRDALGPYRASGGWWENTHWCSEEWDIELENGALYRIARADDKWRVEGSYDEPSAEQRRVIMQFPAK
jgi:protein ImuB